MKFLTLLLGLTAATLAVLLTLRLQETTDPVKGHRDPSQDPPYFVRVKLKNPSPNLTVENLTAYRLNSAADGTGTNFPAMGQTPLVRGLVWEVVNTVPTLRAQDDLIAADPAVWYAKHANTNLAWLARSLQLTVKVQGLGAVTSTWFPAQDNKMLAWVEITMDGVSGGRPVARVTAGQRYKTNDADDGYEDIPNLPITLTWQ